MLLESGSALNQRRSSQLWRRSSEALGMGMVGNALDQRNAIVEFEQHWQLQTPWRVPERQRVISIHVHVC